MWFARLYINGELIKDEYELDGRLYRREIHLDDFSIAESIERFYEDLSESQEELLNDFVESLDNLDFYRYSKSINLDGDIIKVVALDEVECADFVALNFDELKDGFTTESKCILHVFTDYTHVGDYLDGLIFDNINEAVEEFDSLGLEDYLNQLEYLADVSKNAVESLEHFMFKIGIDDLEDIPIPSLLVDAFEDDEVYFYNLKEINSFEDLENIFNCL